MVWGDIARQQGRVKYTHFLFSGPWQPRHHLAVKRRQLGHAAILRTACHANRQTGSHGFDIGSLVHFSLHFCRQITDGAAIAGAAILAKRPAKLHNERNVRLG